MTRFVLLLCLLSSHLSFSQQAITALEAKDHSLTERYQLMKSNSQTFQDYKVIKEFVLDGVWKIVVDSINRQKLLIRQSLENVSRLEASLKSVELVLKKERDAAAQVEFDSTHISVLGIDFNKGTFLTVMSFIFAGCIILISLTIGRMNFMRVRMKEKTMIADLINNEYEEFKRKTLEKQTKLSRELQTERNRIEELMRA
jgi:hypothetical protein